MKKIEDDDLKGVSGAGDGSADVQSSGGSDGSLPGGGVEGAPEQNPGGHDNEFDGQGSGGGTGDMGPA